MIDMEQAEMKAYVEKERASIADKTKVLQAVVKHIDTARNEIRAAAEQYRTLGFEPKEEFTNGAIDNGLAGWQYDADNQLTLITLQSDKVQDMLDFLNGVRKEGK